jgi:branched-chain amino acid transport system substrate-binding protein
MQVAKRLAGLSVLVGLVALALASCGGSSSTGAAKVVIKIGTDLPVSGGDASAGKPAQNGVTLAVEQANANNTVAGYTFVQSNYDDVGTSGTHDPTVGANNVRDMIGHAQIAAYIGPFNSSVAQAEMPIANQAGLGNISPSNTNQTLTKPQYGQTGTYRPTGNVTYFRVCTTDDHQGPALADYLYKQLNLKKVFVIDDTETYGAGIAMTFSGEWTTLGGSILGHVSAVHTSTPSYKPILTQAAALHPDLIFFGGNDSTGGIDIANDKASISGLSNVVLAGGDGIFTSDFRDKTGANGNGAITSAAAVNADVLPAAASFKAAFSARFPVASDYGAYSANSYDATNILIQAIKRAIAGGAVAPKNDNDTDTAKAFRAAVIAQLKTTDYTGVIGHTTFDANGDTTNKWISLYKLAPTTSGTPKYDWSFVYQLQPA